MPYFEKMPKGAAGLKYAKLLYPKFSLWISMDTIGLVGPIVGLGPRYTIDYEKSQLMKGK